MLYHYCVHNFGWTPTQFYELNKEEKAFLFASIELKLDAEKKASRKSGRK